MLAGAFQQVEWLEEHRPSLRALQVARPVARALDRAGLEVDVMPYEGGVELKAERGGRSATVLVRRDGALSLRLVERDDAVEETTARLPSPPVVGVLVTAAVRWLGAHVRRVA